MKPVATDFGDVHLPPTDPRYVDGTSGGRVPDVSGLTVDAARQRLKDARFQVADQPTSVNSYEPNGAVVGTTPERSDQARVDHHDQRRQRDCARTAAGSVAARADWWAG